MSDDCIIISDDDDDIPQSQGTSNQTERVAPKNFDELTSWLRKTKKTDITWDATFGRPPLRRRKRKLSCSGEDSAAKVPKSPQTRDIRKFLTQENSATSSLGKDELPDLGAPSSSKSVRNDVGEISPVFNSSRSAERRNKLSLSWRKKNESFSQVSGPLIKTITPGPTRRAVEASYNVAIENRSYVGEKSNESNQSATRGVADADTSDQDDGVHVIAETSSEDEFQESQVFCEPVSKPALCPPLNVPSFGPAVSSPNKANDDDEVNLLPVTTESESDDDIPIFRLPTKTNHDTPANNLDNDMGDAQREENMGSDIGSETQDISKSLDIDDSGSETQDESKEDIELTEKQDEVQDANDSDDAGSETLDLSHEEFIAELNGKASNECSSPKSKDKPASKPDKVNENTKEDQTSNEERELQPTKLDFSQLTVDLEQVRSKFRPIAEKVVSESSSHFQSCGTGKRNAPSDSESDSEIMNTQSKYFQSKGQGQLGKSAKMLRISSDSSDEDGETSSLQPSQLMKTNHSNKTIQSDDDDDKRSYFATGKSLESAPNRMPQNCHDDCQKSADKNQPVLKLVDIVKAGYWSDGSPKSDPVKKDSPLPRSPSPVENDLDNTVITIESNDLFSGDEGPVIEDSDDEEFRMQMTQMIPPQKTIAESVNKEPPVKTNSHDGDASMKDSVLPCEGTENHNGGVSMKDQVEQVRASRNPTASETAHKLVDQSDCRTMQELKLSKVEQNTSTEYKLQDSNEEPKCAEQHVIESRNDSNNKPTAAADNEDFGDYNDLENFTLLEDDIVCLDDSDDDMFANLTQVDVAGHNDNKDQAIPGDHADWHDEDDIILIEDDVGPDDDLTSFDLKKVKTEIQSSWWDEDIFSQNVDEEDYHGCDDFAVPDIKSERPIVIEPNEMFLSQVPYADERHDTIETDNDTMETDKDKMETDKDRNETDRNETDRNETDRNEAHDGMIQDDEIPDDILFSLPINNDKSLEMNESDDEVPDDILLSLPMENEKTLEMNKSAQNGQKLSSNKNTDDIGKLGAKCTLTSSKTSSLVKQERPEDSLSRLRPSLDLGSDNEVDNNDVYDLFGPSFALPPKKFGPSKFSKYFGPSSSSSPGDSSKLPSPPASKGSPSQKLAMLALKKAKTNISSPKPKPTARKTIMLSPLKKNKFYGKKSPEAESMAKFLGKNKNKDKDNKQDKSKDVPEFEITSRIDKSSSGTSSSSKETLRKESLHSWLQAKKTQSTHSSLPQVRKDKKVIHLGKERKVRTGRKKQAEESVSLTQAICNARAAMASRDMKVKKDGESPEKGDQDTTSEECSGRIERHPKSASHKEEKSKEKKDSKSSGHSKEKTEKSSREKSDKSSKERSEKSSASSSKSSSRSSSSKGSHRSSSRSSRESHHSKDTKDATKKSSTKSDSDKKDKTRDSKEREKTTKDCVKVQDKSKSDSKESSSSSKSSHSRSKDSDKTGSSSSSSRSGGSKVRQNSGKSDKDSHSSKQSKSSKHRRKDDSKSRTKPQDDMSLLSQIIHDQDNLMTADPEMEKHVSAPKKDDDPVKSGASEDKANTNSEKTATDKSSKPQDGPIVSSSASSVPSDFIKSLRATIAAKSQSSGTTSMPPPSASSSAPVVTRNVGADGFAVPLPPTFPRGQRRGPEPPRPSRDVSDVTNFGNRPSNINVAKDKKAVPPVPLTEDSILHMILCWNPSWLQEQVKFGAKSKPPPILDVVRCKELYGNQPPTLFPLLTHGYDSLRDYFKIMLPLMLHEVWAQIFNEFCEKTKKHGGMPSFQAILCQALDRNEFVCEVMFQAIMTEQQVQERKRPMEGTLVIVKLFHTCKENSSQPSNLQLLALATRVERSHRTHPVLASNPKSKERGSSIWNIALKFAPRKHIKFEDNQTVILECLGSIVTTHRHIRALLNLNQIPSCLCRAFLRPAIDRKSFFHQAPPASKIHSAKGQYNASQSQVISAVSSAILQPYIIPKICLIQGPPGTGKSHTILGIIKETLRGVPVDGGKVHILLTAPSNAAVDELVKKLVKDDEKALRAGNQRRVNFIRMGAMSHPAVQEYNLEKKTLRRCEEKFRQQNLPLSIQEELKKLEGTLQDLAMRRRAAVQAGRKSEIVNCEREERNVKKKKDQIEAAYQTSGKPQWTHSERREVEMQLLMNSDVICTTLNSCGLRILMELNNKKPRYPFFNAVIVDEACQSTEIDNLIPLQFKCTKLVLVGDPRQLPATVISKVAENLDYNQSLFERLEKSFSSDRPVMMLDTQYRMHPDICHFPSKHIYEGRLKTDLITASQRETSPYIPYKVFDLVDGQEISSDFGFWNPTELDFVCTLCSFLMKGKPESYMQAIGIISPYRAQSTKLLRALRERGMAIEAATVDGFQGREKDIIIVTCVRAKSDTGGIGFLSDVRRMNVALTRARYACYVVGHLQSLKVNRDWRHLIADAEERKMVARVSRSMDVQKVLQQEIMKKK